MTRLVGAYRMQRNLDTHSFVLLETRRNNSLTSHDSNSVLTWGCKFRIKSSVYYFLECKDMHPASGTHPPSDHPNRQGKIGNLKPFALNEVPNLALELLLLFVGLHSRLRNGFHLFGLPSSFSFASARAFSSRLGKGVREIAAAWSRAFCFLDKRLPSRCMVNKD